MLNKLQQQACRIVGPSVSLTSLCGFFPRTSRIWTSLSVKRFPLTYGLNGYKHRDIFFIWALFKQLFYTLFILILFFLQLHASMLSIEI